ncbi:MAG: UpxY family transcription antiterminator [Bacteroidaceae bacterium]|nr:UpxY family transcription antiterminator [Bacteroidaceae bacterium]
MRATYSREQKAQQLLQEVGVECYIPMHLERSENGERYVPVVHNLIFVHTSRKFMRDIKLRMEYMCPLRYMIDRSTGLPMVVRDKEMEDFMRVTAEMGSDIVYLDNPSIVVTKGTPIEIVCGPFRGVQGRLLRIRRDRKVVLQLAGVVAIAISGIPMEYCKVLQ